jgi:hypothetical protein
MTKSNRHSRKRQTIKRGGAIIMPSEYYGNDSGSYSPVVNASYNTAYGSSVGVSQGMANGNLYGPNLAYGPTTSTLQTGGRKRSKRTTRRKQRSRSSRRNQKNRKH